MNGDFRLCPACGSRNKPKWDFCARCGESLQGVPLGDAVEAEATVDEEPVSTEGVPWVTGIGVLAFGVLAVVVWARSDKWGVPERPNAAIFTMPTMPPARAAARPAVRESGKGSFDEGFRRLVGGDAQGAVADMAQAVADAPENAAYRNMYAKALLAAGSTDEALAQFEAAVRLSAGNVGYLSDAARALDLAGRTAEAAQAYQSVLERQPGHEQTLHDLASLHQRGGRFDLALPLMQRLVEARPDDLALRQELAHVLEKTGDVNAAGQEYAKVLTERPDANVTRGLLAEMRFQQGEKAGAIALLREGLARDAEAPVLHRGLASLLERSGDFLEAIKEYREYARLAPNAPDAQQLADRADQLERRQAAAGASPPGT